MAWPVSQDYNEAVQSPRSNFSDPELREGQAATNALGLPLPRSGSFADVYEFRCPATNGRWAVKCFTRAVPGLRDRYAELSHYLGRVELPFMVDFTYLEEGIRVRGRWYPILKMPWVEGLLLNEFVRDSLDKPAVLESLSQIWVRMSRRLREAGVAHGDLQHGNVLLVPGSKTTSLAVKLVDYDGMFVPTLAKSKPGEVGHPAYQHPRRLREGNYRGDLDRFPLLVIGTALRCLAVAGPALWARYDNGDNLLFREADLRAPSDSALFRELWQLDDRLSHLLVGRLALASQDAMAQVPLVDELLAEGAVPLLDAGQEERAIGLLGTGATVGRTTTVVVPVETPPEATPATQGLGFDFDPSAPLVAVPRRRKAARLPTWAKAAGGAALFATVLGVMIWATGKGSDPGGEGSAAPPKPAGRGKQDAPQQPSSKDAAAKAGAQGQPAEGARPAAAVPRRPVLKRTSLVRVGGTGGDPFENAPAEPALLIGFHLTTVSFGKGPFIKSVQPIYLTGGGRVADATYGQPGSHRITVEAREGYAVGAVLASQNPDDLKMLFMRVQGATLDVRDAYESPWVCGRGQERATVLTGGGKPVVGIYGRCGANADALGLIILQDDPGPTSGAAWILPREEAVGEVRRFEGHTGEVWGVAISPDGRRLVSAGRDKTIRQWETATGKQLSCWEGCAGLFWKVAFTPDGRSILAAGPDRTVRLWDTETGQQRQRFEGHRDAMDAVAVCSDLGRVFSASRDGTCRIWDVRTGEEIGRCGKGPLWVYALAVSAKGDRALFAAANNVVCVWDVEQGRDQHRLAGHTAHIYTLAFSPDGTQGLSAGGDGTARLWDLGKGEAVRRFDGHKGPVHTVAFTPDGRRFLSAGEDRVVRLWSVETGSEVYRFEGHTGAIRSVAVSPDGRYGLSASADKTVRLWRLPRLPTPGGKVEGEQKVKRVEATPP
jgi:hypothetical protein